MDRDEALKLLKGRTEDIAEWNRRRGEGERIPHLSGADLRYAFLSGAELIDADLSDSDLSGADLSGANLSGADLSGANLCAAYLIDADLSGAKLTDAKLIGADLRRANLSDADLSGANLSDAICERTIFADIDLSEVRALDSVWFVGPTTLGIDTIIRSKGKIPEAFLRGCGVPDSFIEYLPSLINSMTPVQFYSCFISYSAKDQKFAERLYNDLQGKGIRCWYAPEDLKIGEKIRVGIDESIRVHDKLLLVLSKHSVRSQWVEKELETAMEKERKQDRTVLFPIRLDDAIMKIERGWPADIRRSRNIGQFQRWNDHDSYQKAFDRLLRDLKVEKPAGVVHPAPRASRQKKAR
jgi:TIR domain/Pentapeptide repeats (8 copies)